ncbi:MAG: hypothetical protein PUE66_08150 [Erysipelotrichaceae bacterium]|nr:hypothetical protein [Erysipelotrichaceae bacterium]
MSWSSTAGTGGSTVKANLIAKNASNVYMSAHVYGGYSLTINGTSKSGSGAALSGSYGGSATLLSNSVWVAYTGNKSITISGSANFSGITISGIGTLGNQTVSTNAALDKVGSAPTLTKITAPTTQVVSETTSSITVTWEKATSYNNSCTYAIGVSINGGAYSYVYPDNNINTTSYTYTVSNKTQGTTYKFSVVAANDVGQSNVIESGIVTLNKLEPPTIADIATYNPYVTSALSVSLSGGSQLNSDAFYRCAALYYGDTQLVSVVPSSTNNTSVSLTYSAANYLSQLGTRKYSDTFKVVAWSQNSNGSKSATVSKEFTVNINSDGGATPTLGAPTLSGGAFNNASTCFIKGVSTLTVTSATGAARRAPSGTTLSYSIGISGSYSQSGSSASWSDLSVGTKTITVTCTDSRGLSTSVTKQCVIQDYKLPTITVSSVARLDSPNTSAKAVYTINYTSIYQYIDVNTKGNQLNGVNSQQYRLNGGTWTNYTSGTAITGLSTDTLYKFELRCTDKVKTSTYCQTQVYTIPTIKHEMSLRKGRLGINCVPQSGYALDVAGKARFTNGIESPVNTSSYLNGSKGTNVLVNSTATGANYKTFLSGPSTNGRFSLSMYQDKVMIGYQAQSSIDAGTNALTKYINLLQEDGSTTLNDLSVRGTITGKCTNVKDSYNGSTITITYGKSGQSSTSWLASWNGYELGCISPKTVLLMAFPVGAVYITYDNNNPGNFLGGTWVQFGQGRVLMGQGEGNDGSTSMSFTTNSTGGEYAHKLTVDEMPSHRHKLTMRNNSSAGAYYARPPLSANSGSNYDADREDTIASKGGDASHNNLQPYITVYFWRRTA